MLIIRKVETKENNTKGKTMTIEDIIRSLEERNREIMDCYDLIEDGSEIITVPVWEDDGESSIDYALITERERIIDMLREVES